MPSLSFSFVFPQFQRKENTFFRNAVVKVKVIGVVNQAQCCIAKCAVVAKVLITKALTI